MSRKFLAVFLALTISVLCLSSCTANSFSDSDMDIYEKIHKYYNKMESYSACLNFTVISNKTQNEYVATQKALGNDKFWIEVKDEKNNLSLTTILNGTKAKLLSDESSLSVAVPTKDILSLLFVNSFFDNYYASEETSLLVNSLNGGNFTTLETELSVENSKAKYITLSINNKTLSPEKIEISDIGKKVWLTGTFSDFKYNDNSINDSVFNTD